MRKPFDSFQTLLELGEILEPSDPPVKPGVEHVMVEIAPGVFRSSHRQKRAPAASLLRRLSEAKALHDSVKSQFEQLQKRTNERRRSQR